MNQFENETLGFAAALFITFRIAFGLLRNRLSFGSSFAESCDSCLSSLVCLWVDRNFYVLNIIVSGTSVYVRVLRGGVNDTAVTCCRNVGSGSGHLCDF